MITANVLIVGRNREDVVRATEVFRARDYVASGETKDPEANEKVRNARADTVVLGKRIEDKSRNRLIEAAESTCSGVKIVEQFGGFENIHSEVESATNC